MVTAHKKIALFVAMSLQACCWHFALIRMNLFPLISKKDGVPRRLLLPPLSAVSTSFLLAP